MNINEILRFIDEKIINKIVPKFKKDFTKNKAKKIENKIENKIKEMNDKVEEIIMNELNNCSTIVHIGDDSDFSDISDFETTEIN